MINLRQIAEADLALTLEDDWGLPVILVDPDGNTINKKIGTDEDLKAQILYDTVSYDLDTGLRKVSNNPIVVLRKSSLSRVPRAGEKWLVRIPVTPLENADIENFVIDPTRPPEGGSSIGFIRLYLRRAQQS